MAEPVWCVVLVRAWLEGGELRVRLLGTGDGGERCVVVTSSLAAAQRLADWLDALAAPPTPAVDGGVDELEDKGATPS